MATCGQFGQFARVFTLNNFRNYNKCKRFLGGMSPDALMHVLVHASAPHLQCAAEIPPQILAMPLHKACTCTYILLLITLCKVFPLIIDTIYTLGIVRVHQPEYSMRCYN